MSGRMPSFILVGLIIIMFLLALFYTSCSSKNTELRISLDQFEERIRSLTIKNSDESKKVENLNNRKRELEEEKLTIQRQMEKKDSEINDLNTKLRERTSEFESLKSDKAVLDLQMKECHTLSETVASKNALIEKLQIQLNSEKELNTQEQSRLKQEIEVLKARLSAQPATNNISDQKEQANVFQPSNQRFQPIMSHNSSSKSIASFLQGNADDSKGLSREVKPNFVQAGIKNENSVLQVPPNINANPENRPQHVESQHSENQSANHNIQSPPLTKKDQAFDQHQENRAVESAQFPPNAGQRSGNQENLVDNSQVGRRNQRDIENAQVNGTAAEIDDEDDEEQMEEDERIEKSAQMNVLLSSTTMLDNKRVEENVIPGAGSPLGRSHQGQMNQPDNFDIHSPKLDRHGKADRFFNRNQQPNDENRHKFDGIEHKNRL